MFVTMFNKTIRWIGKWKGEEGLSLVEIVMILVILGITMVPLSQLSIGNAKRGGQYALMTKAIFLAQERMEQIIADYAAGNAGRGYDWVVANWAGASDVPTSGFSRHVMISSQNILNSVTYVEVHVVVRNSEIEDIDLCTWIVDDT